MISHTVRLKSKKVFSRISSHWRTADPASSDFDSPTDFRTFVGLTFSDVTGNLQVENHSVS